MGQVWLTFDLKKSSPSDYTYIENGTADGCTCLGVGGLVSDVGLSLERRVTKAIIVVKATEGHLIEIVELHHCLFLLS